MTAADFTPQWASQRRHTAEQRRANILAAKPECSRCGHMFKPGKPVPHDLVCLSCRKRAAMTPVESGPKLSTLFDMPSNE